LAANRSSLKEGRRAAVGEPHVRQLDRRLVAAT